MIKTEWWLCELRDNCWIKYADIWYDESYYFYNFILNNVLLIFLSLSVHFHARVIISNFDLFYFNILYDCVKISNFEPVPFGWLRCRTDQNFNFYQELQAPRLLEVLALRQGTHKSS